MPVCDRTPEALPVALLATGNESEMVSWVPHWTTCDMRYELAPVAPLPSSELLRPVSMQALRTSVRIRSCTIWLRKRRVRSQRSVAPLAVAWSAAVAAPPGRTSVPLTHAKAMAVESASIKS